MAREAKLLIVAENLASAAIKSAQGDLSGFEAASRRVGDTLKAAFTATAIIAALDQLGKAALDCVKEFGDMDRTMTQLRTALGGNEASFERMTGLIDKMARSTLAPKDSIESLVAELAALGKSDADIERITEASVALSNVTGKDLQSAFTMINATFDGTAGKLDKLIPELGNLTKGQLEAGGAVDLLNAKFGAISDSMAGGIGQQMVNLKNSFGDLKENIGQGLAPITSAFLSGITSIVDAWTKAIGKTNDYVANAKKASSSIVIDQLEGKRGIATANMEAKQAEYKTQHDNLIRQGQSETNTFRLLGAIQASISMYQQEINSLDQQIKAIKPPEGPRVSPSEAAAAGPGDNLAMSDTTYGHNATWQDAAYYAATQRKEYDEPGYTGTGGYIAGANAYRGDGTETQGQGSGGSAPLGIFDKLAAALGPVIDTFGTMFTSLSSVTQILNPIQTILASMFEVLGPLIDQLLAPIVGILKIFGQILAATLIPILNILTPVIEGVAKVLLWLANNIIIPVGNLMITFYNGIAWVINKLLGWAGVHVAYADKISTVSLDDATAAGSTTSSGTSSSGAAYTGAQSITFNFYNQGNVVGSGGLQELAYLLKSIIDTDARYA
jgi:hypothetical protein